MSPERWKQIEKVYQSALEHPAERRGPFLGQACDGDDDLRREVEALLRQDVADGLLDRPAWDGESDAASEVRLAPGAMLGPYRIEAYLGAGGMGSVYRAADTRLHRSVAIKISGRRFSDRFQKEARAIAALNHPHVCTLYDIGPDYLVMEYVEGETLAERLRKGAMPLDQVLRYGAQIAEALAAAHSRGIVHRDLKPANVMITSAGVKLLDFGLAKISKPELTGDSSATKTAEGSVMGTLPYMAPEQIEGRECTPRTDIFALGLTLYEMATGRRAFSGESRASLTAEILRAEPPPICTLQPLAPSSFEHIIRRCMAKDPDERWQSASDIRRELDWVAEHRPEAAGPTSGKRRILPIALAATLAVAAVLVGLAIAKGWLRSETTSRGTVRFWLTLPDGARIAGQESSSEIAISPDGRKVAMVLVDSAGARLLSVHYLDTHSAQRLDQTGGASLPFWSPDGEFIAFFSEARLRKVRVSGGQPQTICTVSAGLGGTWNRENVIIFSGRNAGADPRDPRLLYQVSAFGGVATPVTALDKAAGEIAQFWPQFLPDGEHFLYFSRHQDSEKNGAYVNRLGSDDRRLLLTNPFRVGYAPPGHLLFVRNQTLFAQSFDPQTLQLRGEPVSLAERVHGGIFDGSAGFDGSENGVLVYRGFPEEPRRRLIWYDRQGKQLQIVGEPGPYGEIYLSPDEKRLAVTMPFKDLDTTSVAAYDVQILEFSRGLFSRLPHGVGPVTDPTWAPDSRRIVVAANRPGKSDLLEVDVYTGRATLLYSDDKSPKFIDDWSGDGRLIYRTGGKVVLLPLGGEPKPSTIPDAPLFAFDVRISPDNRWVAYFSVEPGSDGSEVYVASFPSFAQPRRVSTSGGVKPSWRKDGKELFYLTRDTKLMAVQVKEGSPLETSAPTLLFQTPLRRVGNVVSYAVGGDGKKFLFVEPGKGDQVGVILNWDAGSRK